jgi:D-alanyl-D-alanine carboxypeptidase
MDLPVHDVTRPAVLHGQSNGKLDQDILVTTPGQDVGPAVRLVAPAARAWRALCAAALGEGHTLKATSLVDSYRPFEVQESTFRKRYTKKHLAGRPHKTWKGVRWYQKPKTAEAAVPGTSNHGWGLAVDTGEELDHDAGTESLKKATLKWLVANEERFGFSHETSETWHIRYFAGDDMPAAVLVHESGAPSPDHPTAPLNPATVPQEEEDMPLTDADVAKTWSQDGIIDNRPWRADVATNPKIRPAAAFQISMDEAHAANAKADRILAAIAAAEKTNAATLAAVQALAAHHPSVDTDAVVAAVKAVGAAESDAVAALHNQVAELQAQLAAANPGRTGTPRTPVLPG